MECEDEWLRHGIQRLHRDDVLGGSYFGTVWGPDALVQYASVFIIDRLLAYERYEPSPGDVVLNFFSPKKLTVASRFRQTNKPSLCRHTIAIRQSGPQG